MCDCEATAYLRFYNLSHYLMQPQDAPVHLIRSVGLLNGWNRGGCTTDHWMSRCKFRSRPTPYTFIHWFHLQNSVHKDVWDLRFSVLWTWDSGPLGYWAVLHAIHVPAIEGTSCLRLQDEMMSRKMCGTWYKERKSRARGMSKPMVTVTLILFSYILEDRSLNPLVGFQGCVFRLNMTYWFRVDHIHSVKNSIKTPIQWVPRTISPVIKWPGREGDHSSTSSAEVMNGGSNTSTTPYVFMMWFLINEAQE
jgi:hypothetical protein